MVVLCQDFTGSFAGILRLAGLGICA